MDIWFPDDETPVDHGWWAPLMRFGLAMAHADLPAIDPDDFMFMGRIDRKGGPRIWVSKHILTRRHVNVADDGTPYEYIPPKNLNSRSDGRYVLHRNPKVAWWRLALLSLAQEIEDLHDPTGLEEFDDHDLHRRRRREGDPVEALAGDVRPPATRRAGAAGQVVG